MNDVKNHVGCLSKSIKKADQDLENICFYSLGWPNEKQSTLAGLPTSTCKKSTIHNNTANEEGQKPCWKSLGHLSKKQIRTSKISVSIVFAGQLKNNRHWQGYQQTTAFFIEVSQGLLRTAPGLVRTCEIFENWGNPWQSLESLSYPVKDLESLSCPGKDLSPLECQYGHSNNLVLRKELLFNDFSTLPSEY